MFRSYVVAWGNLATANGGQAQPRILFETLAGGDAYNRFNTGKGSPTLGELFDQHFYNPSNGIKTLEDLRLKPHLLQHVFDPIISERMKSLPGVYNLAANVGRGLHFARSPLVGAAALGLTGVGALGAAKKLNNNKHGILKRAYTDPDKQLSGKDLIAALATAGGGKLSHSFIRDVGARHINPFGKINVGVLGGIETANDAVAKTRAGKAMDSFSAQTHALSNSLQQAGPGPKLNVNTQPIYRPGAQYGAIPTELTGLDPKKLDAVIQVGDSPYNHMLENLKHNDVQRYRLLSDFNEGNFKQPDNWLGTTNIMKVTDDPKSYTRFIVPGTKELPLQHAAQRASALTPNIPVSDVFTNAKFTRGAKPVGVYGFGGGAMGHTMFEEALDEAGNFDPKKLTTFDRVNEAMARRYGEDYTLKMFGTPGANEKLKGLFDSYSALKASGDPRFKNVEFLGGIGQKDVADLYSKASHIFGLPGSTTAELNAMSGTPGKIVNIVPKDIWWRPGHFPVNAEHIEKSLPGARTIQLGHENNPSLLDSILKEGPESMVPHKGVKADFSQFRKLMVKDVLRTRLKNLGKLGVPLTVAGGGLAYLANHLYNATRPKSFSERLKHKLS